MENCCDDFNFKDLCKDAKCEIKETDQGFQINIETDKKEKIKEMLKKCNCGCDTP